MVATDGSVNRLISYFINVIFSRLFIKQFVSTDMRFVFSRYRYTQLGKNMQLLQVSIYVSDYHYLYIIVMVYVLVLQFYSSVQLHLCLINHDFKYLQRMILSCSCRQKLVLLFSARIIKCIKFRFPKVDRQKCYRYPKLQFVLFGIYSYFEKIFFYIYFMHV